MIETTTRMDVGAGGTRNSSGNDRPLVELDHELADLYGEGAVLVFSSGYVSNETSVGSGELINENREN
jgi:5-aminolevulinate synthase